MATIADIVNFEVIEIKSIQADEYQFVLVDGTIVIAIIRSIKTIEDQAMDIDDEIIKTQDRLTALQSQKQLVNELNISKGVLENNDTR